MTRGPGSNGTVNALKTWLKFANPLRWWGLANSDLLNEFIEPIFGVLLPSLVLAEVVSQNGGLSYRPGGMRVYGQAQALTDFPVPLIPGPRLAASLPENNCLASIRTRLASRP